MCCRLRTCGDQLSPSAMWVRRIEFRSQIGGSPLYLMSYIVLLCVTVTDFAFLLWLLRLLQGCLVNGNPAEVHECTHYGHVRINFAFKTAVTYPCSRSPSEYFFFSFQGTKNGFNTENKARHGDKHLSPASLWIASLKLLWGTWQDSV